MIARLKNYILLCLIVLPIGAFADFSNALGFLTPSQGEFSIRLLSKMLGSIGNVLYGEGNQIVGTLMSVINSCAVLLIGVAVCFTVWDAVISSAASGEMMASKGRKTVFTILRIVCGFCLVVPSPTTGYSLAQNGAIWVVVQGVGLANRVSDQLFTYLDNGGLVFTVKPSTSDDIKPFMATGANVMRSAICMYKLQDIMISEQKAQEDAAAKAAEAEVGATVIAPAAKKIEEIGYSINSDDTITFGSRNPKYDANDPSSGYMYEAQCGNVALTVSDTELTKRMGENNVNPENIAAEKAIIMGYLKSGAAEMVQNVLPIAKEISTLDPKSSDYDTSLANLNSRAVASLAGSGISFATLLDPLRRKSIVYMQQDIRNLVDKIHSNGWMYTPLMVITPILTEAETIKVSDYNPASKAPVLSDQYFQKLDEKDQAALRGLIDLVQSQGYAFNATMMLDSLVGTNPTWAKIDFSEIDPYSDKDYLNDIVGWVDMALGIPRTALGYIKGFVNMGFDMAIGMANFFNIGVDLGVIGDVLEGNWKSVGEKFLGWIKGEKKDDVSDLFSGLKDMVNGAIDSMLDVMNELVDFVRENAFYAAKGGMNTQLLQKATSSMGPMGPVIAMSMSAMVGKGIEHMEQDMFTGERNALAGAMRMGGNMMVSSMEVIFQMAHVSYFVSMVQLFGGLGGNAILGESTMKALSGVGSIANSAVSAVTVFYAGVALVFFTGGLLLYIALPLTFVLNFAAASLRWFGLVFVSILAAPIFCFNLIRSDGEGMIGRGERYLLDLGRTTLIPAVLTMGAVIFMLLFNVGFMLLTSMLNIFMQISLKVIQHPYLVPIMFGVILLVVAMTLLYMANMLANLCTHDFVDGVGNALGEALTRGSHENPMHEIKQGVHGGGHQVAGAMKSTVKGGGGKGPEGG